MKLHFKQRFFSWFDSYDVWHEDGSIAYTVQGRLSWGHLLEIHDAMGTHLGSVKEEIFTLLPRFALYEKGEYIGSVKSSSPSSSSASSSTAKAGPSRATSSTGTIPSATVPAI